VIATAPVWRPSSTGRSKIWISKGKAGLEAKSTPLTEIVTPWGAKGTTW